MRSRRPHNRGPNHAEGDWVAPRAAGVARVEELLNGEERGALELEFAAADVNVTTRGCYSHPFIAGEANDRDLPLEYARYVRGRLTIRRTGARAPAHTRSRNFSK